jgi:hypothetical protein
MYPVESDIGLTSGGVPGVGPGLVTGWSDGRIRGVRVGVRVCIRHDVRRLEGESFRTTSQAAYVAGPFVGRAGFVDSYFPVAAFVFSA